MTSHAAVRRNILPRQIDNRHFTTQTNYTLSFFGYFDRVLDFSAQPTPEGVAALMNATGGGTTCIATGTHT